MYATRTMYYTAKRENINARSRILFNEIRKQIVQGMMIRYQNLINISIAFKCNHFYLSFEFIYTMKIQASKIDVRNFFDGTN